MAHDPLQFKVYDGDVVLADLAASAEPSATPGARAYLGTGHDIRAHARLRTVRYDPVRLIHTWQGYQHSDGKRVRWLGLIQVPDDATDFALLVLSGIPLFLRFPDESRCNAFVTEIGPGDLPTVARIVSFDDPPPCFELPEGQREAYLRRAREERQRRGKDSPG